MKSIFALGFLALLSGVGHADVLDAAQIRDELVGKSIAWYEVQGWHSGDLVLLPDGRAELTIISPHQERDTGTWSMRGNELCTQWQTMRGNQAKCYSISPRTNDEFETSGGNIFKLLLVGV